MRHLGARIQAAFDKQRTEPDRMIASVRACRHSFVRACILGAATGAGRDDSWLEAWSRENRARCRSARTNPFLPKWQSTTGLRSPESARTKPWTGAGTAKSARTKPTRGGVVPELRERTHRGSGERLTA